MSAATVHSSYTITFGDALVSGSTHRGRYIDPRLRDHGCPPGWQTATVSLGAGREFTASVRIVPSDDGQRDPELYGEFAESDPDRVRAVLIRRHNPMEQFLAHGTLLPIEPVRRRQHPGTPIIQAADGRALASKLSDLPGVIA